MSESTRYVLCSDGSGHEYFVLVNQQAEFYAWAAFTEKYEEVGYEGLTFEHSRIDGRFTFTDPRND